ncbi:MAG: hypothetical protein BWZ10_01968 [candidate division BRC1 bacterium ADurb.BinA364]|nr:MAG: hypothetical protein BWZ10_01968 [candidate division BRC1 bacterium ADurb.BinA364]
MGAGQRQPRMAAPIAGRAWRIAESRRLAIDFAARFGRTRIGGSRARNPGIGVVFQPPLGAGRTGAARPNRRRDARTGPRNALVRGRPAFRSRIRPYENGRPLSRLHRVLSSRCARTGDRRSGAGPRAIRRAAGMAGFASARSHGAGFRLAIGGGPRALVPRRSRRAGALWRIPARRRSGVV